MKFSPEQLQAIDSLLEKGGKIRAIKIYRQAAGLDLAASKKAVESRLAELRKLDPSRYPEASGACLAVLVLLVSVPGTVLLLYILA